MKDLETQLQRDAEPLHSAESRMSDESLQRAIARENNVARRSPPSAPRWLAWSLPIAVAAAAAWFLIGTPGTQEIQTPVVPQTAQTFPLSPAPLDVQSLQRVSSTAPLEAEWQALVKDLERARSQIEQELPTEF